MVLGLYHTESPGSRRLRQEVLQFPQRFTADGGRRCRSSATADNGIEHPAALPTSPPCRTALAHSAALTRRSSSLSR